MSNMEKAARMIRDLSEVDGETLGYAHVHNIAQALADAGLLAPDLPEPDVDNGVHHIYTAVDNLDVVSLTDHVQINRLEYDGWTAVWDGKPAEARVFAHSLLAATDHAEGEQ